VRLTDDRDGGGDNQKQKAEDWGKAYTAEREPEAQDRNANFRALRGACVSSCGPDGVPDARVGET